MCAWGPFLCVPQGTVKSEALAPFPRKSAVTFPGHGDIPSAVHVLFGSAHNTSQTLQGQHCYLFL